MRSPVLSVGIVSAIILVAGCRAAADPGAEAGQPVAGLTANQLARFHGGQALFNHVFTPAEGLGPLFNENQCSACHTDPVSGGTGEQSAVKVTRFQSPHTCDLLTSEGGENVRKQATPALLAAGISRQPVPMAAQQRSQLIVPVLFGAGLIEAIPAKSILSHADPTDRNGDGVSGRPGHDGQGRLARFGKKADVASLGDFVESAARFEMGLTTPSQPREPPPVALTEKADPVPDPELSQTQVDLLSDFVRYLAPSRRRVLAKGDTPAISIARGERLFEATGCAQCHVASMPTSSAVTALDRKRVYLYSDLLLHDMGTALAGVCATDAAPTEWRTAILMGLRRRTRLLHDGRAADVFEAVRLHGGEAARSRARFERLDRISQEYILTFLSTL